jgi:hypothetical protein
MEHGTGKIFSTTHRMGFTLMKARDIVAARIDAGITPRNMVCQQIHHEELDATGQRKRARSNTGRGVHDLKLALRLLGKFIDATPIAIALK